jgi:diphthamide biosynthesis methyltransferase
MQKICLTSQFENMFYIIGLGLSDEKDITIRGLEVSVFIKKCAYAYFSL